MTDSKVVQHPSALMAIGREAAREGDFFRVVEVLLDMAPPGSGPHIALSEIDPSQHLNEEEMIARTADTLLKLHPANDWNAAVAHATRLAERLPDLSFGYSVLREIERRKEAETGSPKD